MPATYTGVHEVFVVLQVQVLVLEKEKKKHPGVISNTRYTVCAVSRQAGLREV